MISRILFGDGEVTYFKDKIRIDINPANAPDGWRCHVEIAIVK